jgi:DNA replication protein DnaC
MKFMYRVVNGNPDYSQVIPCPRCSIWTKEEREKRLAVAGIPAVRQTENLSTFRFVEGADEAFEAARAIGEGFTCDEDGKKRPTPWKMLLIYGGHGNGKTHLARGAMMAAADRGLHGRYYTVRQLMADLRGAMDKADIISSLKALPFLVLDELGTEDPKSDWQAGVLEDIINYRHDNMLETVLVTNKDITELLPGIASRLKDSQDCKRVLNQAPDYRPKKPLS